MERGAHRGFPGPDAVTEAPLTRPGSWDAALGQSYVAPDAVGPLGVLDAARAEVLRGWVAALIPGNENWPCADQTDAVSYVDAILGRVPGLRSDVLSAIDRLHAIRAEEPEVAAALRQLEAERPEVFRAVYEMTCEAYYRHPLVVPVVEARTGFRTTRPRGPVKMSGFDPARLDRVRAMPALWRPDPR